MRCNKKKGMVLLLEIVIGLGIFVMALLFTFGLFATANRSTTSTKNLSTASDLAVEEMERTITLGYGSIAPVAPYEVPMEATIDGNQSRIVFRPQVDVRVLPAEAAPNNFQRKHILVTVTWNEGNNYDRRVQLETIVVE